MSCFERKSVKSLCMCVLVEKKIAASQKIIAKIITVRARANVTTVVHVFFRRRVALDKRLHTHILFFCCFGTIPFVVKIYGDVHEEGLAYANPSI